MRQSKLIDQIKSAIDNKSVVAPFKSADFEFLQKSRSFISKHAEGNGRYKEYFIKVSRGRYILK